MPVSCRAVLTCSALVIEVAGRALVRDLTFNLGAGDIIVILGPNGVGKSLTLHTLAGLRAPDQGSILLVVFTAFSAAVVWGLWRQLPASALLGLVVVCAVLLTLALVTTTWVARRMGFSKEDEITLVFCGSKKSLASGVPMAKVLFAASSV